MEFRYPHTIDNGGTEVLTFVRIVKDGEHDLVETEGVVQPGGGPPMHIHFLQEESFTVVKGRIGIQVAGKEPEYYEAGSTKMFARGVAHRFWNAGDVPLHIKGYLTPANNIVYFLTQIYKSTKENGGKRPSTFDAAYLTNRYKSEFEMYGLPPFVKNVIMPLSLFFGRLRGKDKKFADAPEPIR